ncbi:2-keto-4-pentenoate hydratase [Streptomyces iconiensis]|uniref:2-keto-4-pentenoate hydratase n=1 Tax=Streptomyces iconiensis TaxID=1384038 RepID=A0ABT7A2I0_9ACTN|nr:2-keto-4-pentenoate hydratase [Streptomyces iconiensis]MDJ1135516.1 2-keto-4-pentenoate hydratase [Streptomyces iconiensis]
MLDEAERRAAAEVLGAAEAARIPVAPLRETWPGTGADDAYAIQLLNVARRRERGARVVGHKVGLSSEVMQRMMGVDEPDYGHLLDDMALADGSRVPADAYCAPRVEVEVGFLLGADLPGSGCTAADVLGATSALVPAIELIDSRVRDWDIGIADTIADNASSAGFVLGAARVPPGEVDRRAIDAALYAGDGRRVLARGRSDAVLGDPANAVAWLARTVSRYGVRLRAGHVVLPGSCTRAVDVVAGERYVAEFGDGLGSVSLAFEATGTSSQRRGAGAEPLGRRRPVPGPRPGRSQGTDAIRELRTHEK